MCISLKTKTAIAVIAKVGLVIIDRLFLNYALPKKNLFKDFVKRIVKKQQLYGSTDNLSGFY
jgi:hypothetical protein